MKRIFSGPNKLQILTWNFPRGSSTHQDPLIYTSFSSFGPEQKGYGWSENLDLWKKDSKDVLFVAVLLDNSVNFTHWEWVRNFGFYERIAPTMG